MYLITSVLALIGTGQYNKFVIGKGEWWRHDPVVVCTSYFESEGRWFQARLFSVFSCCYLRQLRNSIPYCFPHYARNYATAKVRPRGALRLEVRL